MRSDGDARVIDEEDMLNNVLATGAVVGCLTQFQSKSLTSVNVVMVDGQATNQVDVRFDFLKSPYRLTIERIDEDDEPF
jgi:hypothetical protein